MAFEPYHLSFFLNVIRDTKKELIHSNLWGNFTNLWGY